MKSQYRVNFRCLVLKCEKHIVRKFAQLRNGKQNVLKCEVRQSALVTRGDMCPYVLCIEKVCPQQWDIYKFYL